MEITFAPRGILQINEARIIFKNFSGVGSKFNREGDRNFAVVIPEREMIDRLLEEGWNVKVRPPRDEEDDEFAYLPVKIKFNDLGPNVYLITGNKQNRLDEESIGILDDVNIMNVDLDLRPYDWEVNGKTGRTAYLQGLEVTQELDRFAARYNED